MIGREICPVQPIVFFKAASVFSVGQSGGLGGGELERGDIPGF